MSRRAASVPISLAKEILRAWNALQAASPEFFDQLGAELKLHFHNGVYTLVVVIWLMIVQRLHLCLASTIIPGREE